MGVWANWIERFTAEGAEGAERKTERFERAARVASPRTNPGRPRGSCETNPMGHWGPCVIGTGTTPRAGTSPNEVRCLTDQEILIADERGSEAPDLWVNGLPEGETPTGHEHAA